MRLEAFLINMRYNHDVPVETPSWKNKPTSSDVSAWAPALTVSSSQLCGETLTSRTDWFQLYRPSRHSPPFPVGKGSSSPPGCPPSRCAPWSNGLCLSSCSMPSIKSGLSTVLLVSATAWSAGGAEDFGSAPRVFASPSLVVAASIVASGFASKGVCSCRILEAELSPPGCCCRCCCCCRGCSCCFRCCWRLVLPSSVSLTVEQSSTRYSSRRKVKGQSR